MSPTFKLIIGSSVLLALLFGGIILFVIQYSKRVSQYQEELKNRERDRQLALLNASIEAQENERARIGSDIHDDIGPLLSTLKLYMNRIKLIHTEVERNAYIDTLGDQMDAIISEIRRVAKDLVPMVLIEFGLVAALENLCWRISKLDDLEIDFRHDDVELKLSKNEELAIYRIVQEFCNNSIKYARASKIEIELKSDPVSILVKDNGVGFDLAEVQADQRRGMGLKNMSARAQAIDAQLSMDSSGESGTKVRLLLASPNAQKI